MSARSLAAGIVLAGVTPAVVASAYTAVLGGLAVMPLVLVSALIVSFGHVLILGVPTALILRRFGMLGPSSLVVAGFILGMVPFGVLSWPVASSSHSSYEYISGEMVATLVDGVPTAAGWARYAKGVAFFGLLGAIGGLAFALGHRAFEPNYAFERTAGTRHDVS